MKIKSLFGDFYDEELQKCATEGVLYRMRESWRSRHEELAILARLGWAVVPHGSPEDILNQVGPAYPVVVYTDAHRHGVQPDGSDSILLMANPLEAAQQWPKGLVSLFIAPMQDRRAISLSQVHIGRRVFLLEYRQNEEFDLEHGRAWASNRGDFTVRVVREFPADPYPPGLHPPLWSVDYILTPPLLPSQRPIPIAFDYNLAPILEGTGLESLVSARTVADLIAEAFEERADHLALSIFDRCPDEIRELASMGFDVAIQPGGEEEPEKDQCSKSEGQAFTITLK